MESFHTKLTEGGVKNKELLQNSNNSLTFMPGIYVAHTQKEVWAETIALSQKKHFIQK